MNVILIGYPGSQRAAMSSKYLNDKYLSIDFQYTYLNYKGPVSGWAAYLAGYLSYLQDEHIIFALDDYLVSEEINRLAYFKASREMVGDVMCVKLFHCTEDEHKQYPVTTQFTIWNREYLIWLLSQVNTPWEFEIKGSKLFDKKVLLRPCIKYFTNSAVSSKWEGIRLDGLCEEDIQYIKTNF